LGDPLLLILNMGSTSTKVAVFQGREARFQEELPFSQSLTLTEQLPLRRDQVMAFLQEKGIALNDLEIIVSRGGLIKPLPAGIYAINEVMCSDLLAGKYGVHASALGPAIARELAEKADIPAVTLDPPSTDEFHELARFSGIPEIERTSAFHALSQKAAARQLAGKLGLDYEQASFIVTHLGGGITVGAHLKGKVVDCTHGLHEGPFTPERAGGLPTLPLIELAQSGLEQKELQQKLVGNGGLSGYLGTKDVREIEKQIDKGDGQAELALAAMIYQVAKEIGSMAAVLQGKVDAIVLTGGLTRSSLLVGWLEERISFLAPVHIVPENEMLALAEGGLRALSGVEQIQTYE